MYQTISAFKQDWAMESEATAKVFANLTNESLSQKVYPEGRTLGFIAWHISQTVGEMMGAAGLTIDNFDEKAPAPSLISEISEKYAFYSKALLNKIDEWNDTMLDDDLDMYGQTWKRRDVLKSLIFHQIHHRGQMSVLMRQAGVLVPGVYGPSKEEWGAYGMPAQD